MKATKMLLAGLPVTMMIVTVLFLTGIEVWLVGFGKTEAARLTLGQIGIAAPYVVAAATGVIFLFATAGSSTIRAAAWGVIIANIGTIVIAAARETMRLASIATQLSTGTSVITYLDPATLIGAVAAMMSGCFAIRVAMLGNAAFARATPRRIIGRRALHGEADWMNMRDAARWIGLRRYGSRCFVRQETVVEFRTVFWHTKPSASLGSWSVPIATRCVVELCSQTEGTALGRSPSMG
jgi:type IV secretion system protein VirD4